MRIVIGGATRLGAILAGQLIENDHEVVIIDQDSHRLEELAEHLDCGMIHGDASHPSTLREAAGDSNDVLVALTDSDEDNVLCALVGRSIGFNRVIPRIGETELGAICEELGLEDFIASDDALAASLLASIEEDRSPGHESPLSGNFRITAFDAEGGLEGRKLDDIDLGNKVRFIALHREEGDHFADADIELQRGDRLMLIGGREALREARDRLAELDKTAEDESEDR